MQRSALGFTVVEVMVVMAIIGLLSSIVMFNTQGARARSRDIDRQADLRTIQAAIELYKNRHGRYPAGCNGANNWSGQIGMTSACTDTGTDYIRGHAADLNFTPAFIAALPKDPRPNGGASGYAYVSNANGTVYKLVAKDSVESETVTDSHDFKSCASSCTPTCLEADSYGVWGGYADTPANTTAITCKAL